MREGAEMPTLAEKSLLIAAAHGTCYSMVVAANLGKRKASAKSTKVICTVTGEKTDAGRLLGDGGQVVGELVEAQHREVGLARAGHGLRHAVEHQQPRAGVVAGSYVVDLDQPQRILGDCSLHLTTNSSTVLI